MAGPLDGDFAGFALLELGIGGNAVKAMSVKVMPSSPPSYSAECERRNTRDPTRSSVIWPRSRVPGLAMVGYGSARGLGTLSANVKSERNAMKRITILVAAAVSLAL